MTYPGKRLPDSDEWPDLGACEYVKHQGVWWVCAPTGDNVQIRPGMWTVEEHEDGTITVSPSLNIVGRWHGWLKKGIWEDAAQP